MPSGEEIQAALKAFVGRWRDYAGTERAEAQTYLNELLLCYGTDRRAVGAEFEYHRTGAGFMDLHWPEWCIFEMKAPSRASTLSTHYQQVFDYWMSSADDAANKAAARYVVLCAFQRFEVWEPGRFPRSPRAAFTLEELPDRYDALGFLSGPGVEPSFIEHHRVLTEDAAETMAVLFKSLIERAAAPADEIQRFIMQSVWTLFAEDLGLLDGYPLQNIVTALRRDPSRSSAAEIGHLYRVLNQKSNHNRKGVLAGTRYVNGELFAQPAEVDLDQDELTLLATACEYDWRQVDPTIFGSLMEGILGRSRWDLGAHYTHEVDILKIVIPTIVRPWRERISASESPIEARQLLDELCAFRVLDPACGCGNFLYIAYRELRGLEKELKDRISLLAKEKGLPLPAKPWPFYPLTNLYGIDIENVAVLIARVTLWMGHRQMIDLYGEAEDPLPLVTLSTIRRADALQAEWPDTDCIIGNPPFLGDRNLRQAFGGTYVAWLEEQFGVGLKDFCVYWFRKTNDQLQSNQRAGLVGTNSISQNRARSASLDYIVGTGGVITDAVSSQKWPGEAKVHVSLVNWIKSPTKPVKQRFLDGIAVSYIGSDLSPRNQVPVTVLPGNSGHAFYGPVPIGKGFTITKQVAMDLRAKNPANSAVVRPYLTGSDIVEDPRQQPRRWCIDFGLRTLEEAQRFPDPLAIVRRDVKPERDDNRRPAYRRHWWLFGEPCKELRAAIAPLSRHIVGLSTGKRPAFTWSTPGTSMNNSTVVFAFEDDYAMGILTSRAHTAWAWTRGSTLKGDLRYTPTSVFGTFPWPCPITAEQRELVADASRKLLARRTEICIAENIGLTKLYNLVDEGAWTEISTLHQKLDHAVADCYGWPISMSQNEAALVERLAKLNLEIGNGTRSYEPFGEY
jgi:hypothetical protein